ncbi:MAG: P-loop NTPase [Deltaproteobacteria bacterium]|jgi:flagellar biosynthesis protein FlhG|nr:P-loop NTPase [Deltaproteobacteria bacterium]
MLNLPASENQLAQPRICAIGGGKGGVGKSILCTSMAITLANQGYRCIMIDADLGGANLHTFLGMSPPNLSLSDMFRDSGKNLDQILLKTPFENLGLVSGSKAMLNIANLQYQQKLKVIRQVASLDADYIFIDLGAGSAFNVLDFFIFAHDGLLVLTPTPTAIENTYHFLRAAYFRKLRQVIRDLGAETFVDEALNERVKNGIRSPRDLMHDLMSRDSVLGQKINSIMEGFCPKLIINQVQHYEDEELGHKIALACQDFFGIELAVAGVVRTDEKVLSSLKLHRPAMTMYPHSVFAEDVKSVVEKCMGSWNKR